MGEENNTDTSALHIRVTEEQKELIYAMWNHYGWSVEEVPETPCTDIDSATSGIDLDGSVDGNYDGVHIHPLEECSECMYCLCRPCVTDETHRQLWWKTEVTEPNRKNHKERKRLYRRFWVMLLHRGVFADPRYIERKQSALLNRQAHAWTGPHGCHPRDLMPKCVLSLVRTWLPNLLQQPYMGHRWQ